MADKTIGELKKASALYDDSLLPMEQSGEAMALEGAKLRAFAENAGRAAGKAAVTNEVELAAGYADAAQSAADRAKQAAKDAQRAADAVVDVTEDAEAAEAAKNAASADAKKK